MGRSVSECGRVRRQGAPRDGGCIDLNSIRAGLVGDPADYCWSSYGEAAAGQKLAQSGLRRLVESLEAAGVGIKGALLAGYRVQLLGRGGERTDADGHTVKKGFTEERIEAEKAAQGATPLPKYLQRRVRYFTDGGELGIRGFVNALFESRTASSARSARLAPGHCADLAGNVHCRRSGALPLCEVLAGRVDHLSARRSPTFFPDRRSA